MEVCYFVVLLLSAKMVSASHQLHPNILIIVADDLGIGDLGCFGNDTIRTPNIDRLAREGLKLNHHLAAAAYCTPSRAALLTARYPTRYGLAGKEGTIPVILHVASYAGLPEEEITLAEALSASNYATAAIGKWHLGSGCGLFGRRCLGPKKHGFDYFYGMPATLVYDFIGEHSFWPFDFQDPQKRNFVIAFLIIVSTTIWRARRHTRLFLTLVIFGEIWLLLLGLVFLTHFQLHPQAWWKISPWLRQIVDGVVMNNDGEVLQQRAPYEGFSRELIDISVNFITSSSRKQRPFFLYHSFTHVHTPMFTARDNEGRSSFGNYGDNVEELDDGVGELMKALIKNGIEEDTIVYFVSDHGGHLEVIDPTTGQRIGGHNKEFKGGKGQGGAEGGIRVPGILKWPNHIPANSTLDHPISLLDMMPTLLHLARLPPVGTIFHNSNELDGQDMGEVILNPGEVPSGTRILIHHCESAIQAMRLIQEHKVYKMYLELHKYPDNSTQCGWGNVYCGCYSDDIVDVSHQPHLYELKWDPFENHLIDSASQEYQVVVGELLGYLKKWKKEVVYPPSQFESVWNSAFLPWLQPF